MHTTERYLPGLMATAFLMGLALPSAAVNCRDLLPGNGDIAGWKVMAHSTTAGKMGQKASYDAYDGAVEAMQGKGITEFAQRMYKHAATGKYVTVDVYKMSSALAARKLHDAKLAGYKKAKPLYRYTSIKDRALIGTMGFFSFGVCYRGTFLFEVSMSKASRATDRGIVKSFLTFMSKKLAPPKTQH